MKKILAIMFCCGVVTATQAQTRNKIDMSRSIDDNGKTMTIHYNGTNGGTQFDYKRTFDVTGWSKVEKDALVRRIADTLNLSIEPPAAPPPPPASEHSSASTSRHGHANLHSDIDDNGRTMRIRINGTVNEKPVDFDRVYDVQHMSKADKNRIIKNVTDSIGISGNVKVGNR